MQLKNLVIIIIVSIFLLNHEMILKFLGFGQTAEKSNHDASANIIPSPLKENTIPDVNNTDNIFLNADELFVPDFDDLVITETSNMLIDNALKKIE